MFEERVPPHDLEAEATCLGACLLGETEPLEAVVDRLTPGDFYDPDHRAVYEAVLAVRPGYVSLDTVLTELKRKGSRVSRTHLENCINCCPAPAQASGYADVVAHHGKCRRAIYALTATVDRLYSTPPEMLDELAQDAAKAIQPTIRGFQDVQLLGDVAAQDVQRMQSRKPGDLLGTTWGFKGLDNMSNGLEKRGLYIIGARPGMGKTALALEICRRNAGVTGKWWLFVTFEMAVESLAQREVISMAAVDGNGYRKASLGAGDWKKAEVAAMKLRGIPVYATGNCRTMKDIRNRALWLTREKGEPGGILVDYLQLIGGVRKGGDNRTEEVSQISRDIKHMAIELDCPVIALSALSRGVEGRPDKRPMLSDIRESGQIEFDAEIVFGLYRDAYYNPSANPIPGSPETLEVIILKQRNGPMGTVELAFKKEWGRFTDIERRMEARSG